MMRSCLVLTMLLVSVPVAAAEEKPPVVPLWPGKPPGQMAATGKEADTTKEKDGLIAGRRLIRLGNVSEPTITVYKPTKAKDTGAAVVVCPGGAYHILALDLEGTEVCAWLNSLGITGVLLKYRVPRPKQGAHYLPALMDAQRAVRLTRSRAKEWGINPNRIGILGFSAGGHLATMTATSFDRPAYEAIDQHDEVSPRPDFAILVYPAYLQNAKKDGLADEVKVTKQTPPAFIAHAGDDPIPVEGSAYLYLALKKVGVPADLHIFESGGHGYGLRPTDKPVTHWPKQAEAWLRQTVLKKAASRQ
ncbi:MAG: alpha/beta hydrolase [Gemmataceae bacterium]